MAHIIDRISMLVVEYASNSTASNILSVPVNRATILIPVSCFCVGVNFCMRKKITIVGQAVLSTIRFTLSAFHPSVLKLMRGIHASQRFVVNLK